MKSIVSGKLALKLFGLVIVVSLLFQLIKLLSRVNQSNNVVNLSSNQDNSIANDLPLFNYTNMWIFHESEWVSEFQILSRKTNEPDCSSLYQHNPNATLLKSAEKWEDKDRLSDQQLLDNIKGNCNRFLDSQRYFLNLSKHKEEENFKMAFTMLVFKSASQVERLLRTIYRPWNYYCVHVDKKSNKTFYEAIEELVKCLNNKYNNIVNTKNRVDVKWGQMSLLTADLNCMKEVYDRHKDWKYLINLTGQEFPLKTNLEIVQIIKSYRGANDIDGSYKLRHEDRLPLKKMPFPMVWFKGEIHITANRDFIKFIFESPKSKIILDAIKDLLIPDETFYSTLNFNPQFLIPGTSVSNPDDNARGNQTRPFFMTRYKNWGEYSCMSNKITRDICIWGVADLPKLVTVPHLFTNKFYEDFQQATLRCLERLYYKKMSRESITGHTYLNVYSYRYLPFVINQIRK